MLKTGASLVVDDDSAHGGIDPTELSGAGPKEYYGSNGPISDAKQTTTGRRRPANTRKRKRRPQFAETGSSVAASPEDIAAQYWRGHVEDDMMPTASATSSREDSRSSASSIIRKRKQPAVREPLAALEKEQKLFELRDRQRQDLVTDVAGNQRNKAYRRPYSQSKKESSQQLSSTAETPPNTAGVATQNSKTSVDLKNILKNSGGLSLSEILQQQNLSLDDLLKGKKNALLALQTTAAVPSNLQKSSEGNQKQQMKPIRRTPYYGAASSTAATAHTGDVSVSSSEATDETESDDPQMIKSKLKIPALQRLKLFGTSSRSTATPGNVATFRKREPVNSTTSTTTTTTRVPIYKKRLPQQRPTLKSPLLFKVPSSVSTTKEVPTSMETLTTTNINSNHDQDRYRENEEEEIDDDDDDEQAEQETEKYLKNETENEDDKDENEESTMQSISTTTTTTTQKPPKLTTTNRISTIPAATSATTTVGSFKNLSSVHLNSRVELQEFNFKQNAIETNDEKATKLTTTQPNNSDNDSIKFNDDELENFFGEENFSPPLSSPPSNNTQSQESKETSTENITPRINHYPPKPTSYLELIPDFDGVDDRTDLLELIEDRRSGNRLFKVLEQRNMTLEELIEHRKRGSSALHLSTIVQNENSRLFPGQKVVLHDNMDIVTAFENFPHFNLMDLKSVKPDDIKTDSQGSSYFTSIIDIEPTDEIYKDDKGSSSNGDNGVRGPAYLPPQRSEKSIGFFPSWKTLALASLATTTRDAATKRNPFFLPQPQLFLDNNSAELDTDEFVFNGNDNGDNNDTNTNLAADTKPPSHHAAAIDTAEAIENEVARAHDLLDLELSGHGFKRSPAAAASMSKPGNLYVNMPAGIRSAIVASAAIVLTSMATFMVIFVVCRWKQHRRRKTNYVKTYNAMKSKLPTIATASRRSSMRNNIEEMVGGSGASAGGISTVSSTSPVHQLQRQSSLLFPRTTSDTNTAIMSGSCTNAGRGTSSSSIAPVDRIGFGNSGGGGIFCSGSRTGSTTSLALSLQSVHNLSTTKLNTMDPNSPEVHEYLFDTLRKSF